MTSVMVPYTGRLIIMKKPKEEKEGSQTGKLRQLYLCLKRSRKLGQKRHSCVSIEPVKGINNVF